MTPAQRTAQTILARLGELRAGHPAQTLPLEQLEDLARAVLATGDATLGRAGPLLVSLDAARAYGAIDRVHDDERARRELTVIAYEAKEQADGSWRVRRRATDLDVSCRVAIDRTVNGPLNIVAHASVRPRNAGGRRG